MPHVETYLRKVAHRIAFVRGGSRLVEPVRRHFVKHYAGTSQSRIVVDDFDGDMRLRVDRASYMGSLIYWRGYHSYRELRCLDRLLTPAMNFVDVGANRGEFTIFAAKRLPQGQVVSFEPVADIHRELLENIELNQLGNVTAFDCGLADRNDSLPLYTTADLDDAGSWNEGLGTLFPTFDQAVSVGTVKLRRLDDVVRELDLHALHCLKIDVEGAELAVLRGAAECLERFRPVLLLELNAATLAAANCSNRDIANFLTPFGYQLHVVDRLGVMKPVQIVQVPDFCSTVWTPTGASSCTPTDLARLVAA
jgi:FkbM family methyltransferase